jgi:hypothetical protein
MPSLIPLRMARRYNEQKKTSFGRRYYGEVYEVRRNEQKKRNVKYPLIFSYSDAYAVGVCKKEGRKRHRRERDRRRCPINHLCRLLRH